MLSAEQIEPATEYPEIIPIEPEPPKIIMSPIRRTFTTRILLYGALRSLRLALQHNARASVGLNSAPASYVASQLRLGTIAARQAKRLLEEALEVLQPENIPHPGIRPGCRELPRYPKPKDQNQFHSWIPIVYYKLFLSPILQDGRMLATIPQRLMPVEIPKIKGLVVCGAELKGTGTRFFGAWTERSGIFIGWMRTRPNLAGDTPDSIFAIGEVLDRPIFHSEIGSSLALQDALELFRQTLLETSDDLGVL